MENGPVRVGTVATPSTFRYSTPLRAGVLPSSKKMIAPAPSAWAISHLSISAQVPRCTSTTAPSGMPA